MSYVSRLAGLSAAAVVLFLVSAGSDSHAQNTPPAASPRSITESALFIPVPAQTSVTTCRNSTVPLTTRYWQQSDQTGYSADFLASGVGRVTLSTGSASSSVNVSGTLPLHFHLTTTYSPAPDQSIPITVTVAGDDACASPGYVAVQDLNIFAH